MLGCWDGSGYAGREKVEKTEKNCSIIKCKLRNPSPRKYNAKGIREFVFEVSQRGRFCSHYLTHHEVPQTNVE